MTCSSMGKTFLRNNNHEQDNGDGGRTERDFAGENGISKNQKVPILMDDEEQL